MIDKEHLRSFLTFFGGPNYDPIARNEFINEMQSLDPQHVFSILESFFSDSDLDTRANAMTAALKINRELGLGLLLPFLTDSDEDLRYHLCGLLNAPSDLKAVKPLMEVLREDSDPGTRGMAAFGLGGIGSMSAIPLLTQVSKFDHEVDCSGYAPSQSARQAIHKILMNQVIIHITSSSKDQIEMFYPKEGCLKGKIKYLPNPLDWDNLPESLQRNTFEYTQSWQTQNQSLHSFPILVDVVFSAVDIQIGRRYLFTATEDRWAVGIYMSVESDDFTK